jgi:Domain of unknown function (DUF6089)
MSEMKFPPALICRVFLLFFLIVGIPASTTAQNISFGVGGGLMYYNGDLSDASYMPPSEIVKPYFGADISFLIVDRFDLSLRYMHGSVEGADSLADEKDNKARNLSFKSNIDEVSAVFRYRIFRVMEKRLINPFVFLGLGYFWFNPTAEVNGVRYDLQPLGTEGQFIEEGNYEDPYELQSFSLATGFGVFVRLGHQWALRLEAAPQLTFTDYLDDVSTIFPDSTALANTPNGEIAVLASSKRPKGFPDMGRARGNADRDDVMVSFGISIVFTPVPKNCRGRLDQRVGYFNKIKGKAGWWGNSY